jgi:hypothetical protein
LSALAVAATLSLSLAACGGGDDEEEVATPAPAEETAEFEAGSRMAELAEAGALKVGTKFDQPLFGWRTSTGEPEGFDVEIAKLIAAKLGIAEDKIEFTEAVSANREPFLEQGRVDMVVATYTMNDKRDMVVDFAGPYFEAGQDIMVAKGNPKGIMGPDDLAGNKVCSVSGSDPGRDGAGRVRRHHRRPDPVRHLPQVPRRPVQRPGRRGDHRQRHPVRLRQRGPGRLRAGRRALHRGARTASASRGPGGLLRLDQRDAGRGGRGRLLREAFESTAGEVIEETPELPEPKGCEN